MRDRAERSPIAGTHAVIVTTDDGTVFSCSPRRGAGPDAPSDEFWQLTTADARYVGPSFHPGTTDDELRRLVCDWWRRTTPFARTRLGCGTGPLAVPPEPPQPKRGRIDILIYCPACGGMPDDWGGPGGLCEARFVATLEELVALRRKIDAMTCIECRTPIEVRVFPPLRLTARADGEDCHHEGA